MRVLLLSICALFSFSPASMAEEGSSFSKGLDTYIGAYYGSHTFQNNSFDVAGINIGATKFITDNVFVGLEIDFREFQVGSNFTELFTVGRIGYGISDSASIYLHAGKGKFDNSISIYTVGGGLEYSINDRFSIRAQVEGIGASGGDIDTDAYTLGVATHF